MEIEPDIAQVVVLEIAIKLCELVTDPFLASFFVNEVHQVLLTIHLRCLAEVHLGRDSGVL